MLIGSSGSPPSIPSHAASVTANISMKLPAFWPDTAKVWFAQADAQFAIKHVMVSKNKFYHTVAVLPLLPQEVAAQLLILLWTPPALNHYEVLQERLITLYSLKDYQRFEALVSLPLAGDQKPSPLIKQMLTLLPEDFKPSFIFCGLLLH